MSRVKGKGATYIFSEYLVIFMNPYKSGYDVNNRLIKYTKFESHCSDTLDFIGI